MDTKSMNDWELWDTLLKAEAKAQELRAEYTRRGLMKTPFVQWSHKPPKE